VLSFVNKTHHFLHALGEKGFLPCKELVKRIIFATLLGTCGKDVQVGNKVLVFLVRRIYSIAFARVVG